MKIWIGVTDDDWFRYLAAHQPEEVNFWQPSGSREFKVLQPGEPFLFKLHSPNNYVVGGGFFVRYTRLPCSLAWEAFKINNGVASLQEFLVRIAKYRSRNKSNVHDIDPVIGCNVLANTIFFQEKDWIPIPNNWSPNIVQGKTYNTDEELGNQLWTEFQTRFRATAVVDEVQEEFPRYGLEYLARARLGQGAFRILVTDAYHRRCAVTGERTLPVLEAAHIKPYSESGPNFVRNGLLLRSDIHKLFDIGYVTISPDMRVIVSDKIKEEYENGREYYAHHGQRLVNLPEIANEQPSTEFLEWHNERVFIA